MADTTSTPRELVPMSEDGMFSVKRIIATSSKQLNIQNNFGLKGSRWATSSVSAYVRSECLVSSLKDSEALSFSLRTRCAQRTEANIHETLQVCISPSSKITPPPTHAHTQHGNFCSSFLLSLFRITPPPCGQYFPRCSWVWCNISIKSIKTNMWIRVFIVLFSFFHPSPFPSYFFLLNRWQFS